MKLKYLLAASVVSLSAAAAIAPAPVMAQQITSGVQGTVSDDSGNPIAGATVTVTDSRTGVARTLTTDSTGSFRTDGLVTGGPYIVAVSAGGFEGQSVQDLYLTLQGNSDVTFNLTSGSGEIVVSAARAVTQLATGPGVVFSTDVIESAPTFDRDIRDVIKIDPRVSIDRNQESDRISCLGGNDRGNAFTIDGIPQSDVYGLNDTPFSSRTGTPIPYDAIRETSVEFAPFSVEYGNFTGCAINAVTKSGTNDIHGSAFFTYSDSSLAGNSVAGLPALAADEDKRWGATLGGPIIRDRLFLFGAYEHVEIADSQDDGPIGAGFTNERAFITEAQFDAISEVLSSRYGIDTGPIVRSIPFESDRYFVRADAYLTDDQRLTLTYQNIDEAKVRPDDAGSNTTFAGLNNFYLSGSKSEYYSARLYSNWTDNFTTEIGYARSDITDVQDPVGGGEAQDENPITRIVVGVQNGAAQGLFVAGPGFSRSANRLETTIDQVKLKGILSAGAHTITIGGELNSAHLNNLFIQNGTGTLYFRDINALIAGTPNSGTATNVTSPSAVIGGATYGADVNATRDGDPNSAAADFTRNIWSAYIQDEWNATDRLLLTGGVRVDWFDGGRPDFNPVFFNRYGQSNTIGFSNLDPIVMPRLAFDYDAGDFGFLNTVRVKGGVGLFSGGDPVVLFANSFQNNGFASSQGRLTAAACGSAAVNVLPGGTYTGLPACVVANGAASAAQGLGDTQSIDPDIKQPSVLRANLGLAARLGEGEGFFSGWNLNLDYIYSQYRNPLTLVDLSMVPATQGSNGSVVTGIGLNGYTIDGRPIYRAIDPLAPGCTARLVNDGIAYSYTGIVPACFNTSRDDEIQLTNAGSYRSHIASIVLNKRFNRGIFTDGGSVFISGGYAYTDAQDRRNIYRSTASSNYDQTAAFDRQNPPASRGFYESRHNVTLGAQFKEQFLEDLDTGFGFTFVGRSGRPYSLTFGGNGTFYDSSSGNDNALLYIPTGPTDPNLSPSSNAAAVASLVDYVNNLDCARKYAGRTIPRNTCTNDWFFDMDLNFSQELPGPLANDSFRLSVTFDNFLNLLDDDWNVFRRRDFEGLVNVVSTPTTSTGAGLPPVDTAGRYIISAFAPDDAEEIQSSSSLWRVKFGISYNF